MAQMDLRAETPFNNTGIWQKQGKIAMRITAKGELHMPKIGTSMSHDEGVHLILEYLRTLGSKKRLNDNNRLILEQHPANENIHQNTTLRLDFSRDMKLWI